MYLGTVSIGHDGERGVVKVLDFGRSSMTFPVPVTSESQRRRVELPVAPGGQGA